MSTSLWFCQSANITRIQFMITIGQYFYNAPQFDSIGVISSLTRPLNAITTTNTSTPSPTTAATFLPICTYGSCLPNPCMNGGACLFSSFTNERECTCVNGYFGEVCESQGQWWGESVSDISAPFLSSQPTEQTDHFPGAILGPPDVVTRGADGGGFRFETRDDQGVLLYEYVELFFPKPVYLSLSSVVVIESLNPGCITRLLAKNSNNSSSNSSSNNIDAYVEIWVGNSSQDISFPIEGGVYQFQPSLLCIPDFPVQYLRIEVNTSLLPGWEEYDAVSLLGSLTSPSSSSSSLICPSLCTPSSCLRGVCATRVNKEIYCRCPPLWTGAKCERPSSLQMSMFLRKQFAVITGSLPTEVCYINTQGEVHCYSQVTRVFSPPPGRRYIQVVLNYRYVCALDDGGRAECWVRNTGASYFVTNTSLSFIAAGLASMCGIKTSDAKIQCFICESGFSNFCDMDFYTRFTSLVMGEEPISCALSFAGQPVCFPYNNNDPFPPQWSISDPPAFPPVKQLDIGDASRTVYPRCFLFTNGSVSCQNRSSTSRFFLPLLNNNNTKWENVVVGENGDVCGVYESGIINCQDDLNSLNIGSFYGQPGFLAMQADHMRGTRAARIMCAIDSRGVVICAGTPVDPDRFSLPTWANVSLPCDYMNGGCGDYAQCTNVVSGVRCECPSGFDTMEYPDLGYADCVDVDECARHLLACPPFQYCYNLIGDAECRDYLTPHVNHVIGCDPALDSAQLQYHPENCSTVGGQVIMFCGYDITAENIIVIGRGAGECANVSLLPPNTTVYVKQNVSLFCPQAFSCSIPEGRGAEIDLSIIRGGQGGQAIDTGLYYSYASPSLLTLGGCVEECARISLPRPILELSGQNFGSTPVVLVGGQSCPLLTHNHTFITCSLPQGRGVQPLSVVVGGQLSNFLTLSYASCLPGQTDPPSDQRNNLTCVPCQKGYAKDAIGSSPCTLCSTGKYALGIGSVKCMDCVQSGLSCSDGIPQAQEQYWGFSVTTSTLTLTNPLTLTNTTATTVTTTTTANTTFFAVVRCAPNHCLENNECVQGREQTYNNILCARCEKNLVNWGNTCVECGDEEGKNSFNFGLFLFMILLCEFFLVFSHLMKRGSQKAGVTRLLVYFVQISLVMAGSSQLHISFLNIVNFDLATASSAVSNSCVFNISPENQLVVLLLQPLIFLAVLLFNFGFRHATWRICFKYCVKYTRLKSWQKRPQTNGYFRSGLALLLFAYSSTCTKVFHFLRCQQVSPDGMESVNVMFYYPTISCDGSFYSHFRPLVIFVLVFYVLGFPIMSLCLLSFWKSKGLLEEKKSGCWGVLYELYHTRVFFWQSVELLLRFIFALIDSQFSDDYLVRASLFSFVNLTALLGQIVSHPYINTQVNKLESVVHSILLCLAFLLSTDATGNVKEGASWVFFTFVLLVLVLLGSVLAYQKTRALYTFYTQTKSKMLLAQRGETALFTETELTSQHHQQQQSIEAHPDPTKEL